MKFLFTTFTLLSLALAYLCAQENKLIISDNIILPKDSIIKQQLIQSLNGFLNLKENPNYENTYVLNSDLLEASALLDEMKEIEKSGKFKDNNFYKAYLSNLAPQNDSSFIIQLSYIGVNEKTPILRACFRLIARKKGTQFYFSSPLKHNTTSWKKTKINNTIVYFKNNLNLNNAKSYFKQIEEFDAKLKAPMLPVEYYCCENFQDALQLTGIDYKSDYNGYSGNILRSKENNTQLVVNGSQDSEFAKYDPHDLWHSRLHFVLSNSLINRPVDEGCAYLYGGSWGILWKDILEKFKKFAASNPGADWLSLYNESKNFDEKGKYPLNVDYTINALFVKKIEKEKGFDAVMELLSCGKKEKDNENYFKALEKITGITKSNFNATVSNLILIN